MTDAIAGVDRVVPMASARPQSRQGVESASEVGAGANDPSRQRRRDGQHRLATIGTP